MHISLRASEDGQTLEIKSLSLDHNHEINQVFFGLTCVADAPWNSLTKTVWSAVQKKCWVHA